LSRIALLVGIDDYPTCPLSGCVSDASTLAHLLKRNEDGSANFTCKEIVSSKVNVTRGLLRTEITDFFAKGDADVALLFFAGHGSYGESGGFLVTQDAVTGDPGLSMAEVIGLANKSSARERVIILDCCHSGAIEELNTSLGTVALNEGVSILAACRSNEGAMESSAGGFFTSNIQDALQGGAADVRGKVTIAATYAYVNEVFTHLEQRPLFRASVSRVTSLRTAAPAISDHNIRQLPEFFPDIDAEYPLSPAYEPTAVPNDPEKEGVFSVLQQMRAARLVEPVGAKHLYFAAMESKACKLTPLGKFYWRAVDAHKI
jgi:hypothetical protein